MMNNRGVNVMIHQGNYDYAVWCFQKSLTAIKNYHQSCSRYYGTTPTRCEPIDSSSIQRGSCSSSSTTFDTVNEWMTKSKVLEKQSSQSHTMILSAVQGGRDDNNYPYLCTTPITIFEEFYTIQREPTTLQPPSVYAAIVLFNLAVAYNLKGMIANDDDKPTNNLVHIRTAIAMYELCHECIQDGELCDFGPYFLMILANNLGVCNALLSNHSEANQFFHYVLSLQMYNLDSTRQQLRSYYDDDETTTIMTDNDEDGGGQEATATTELFWYNTSKLILSDCTAPAA